jgi:hypothetical protein
MLDMLAAAGGSTIAYKITKPEAAHQRAISAEPARARAVKRAILVAAAKGKGGVFGDIRAQQEEARTEARCRAVGIVHDIERAIFRAALGVTFALW